MLALSTKGLPTALLAALKHTASFHNLEFYRRQSQRYSTWDTPRMVCSFDATDPDWLKLPRGLADEAAQLVAAAGSTLSVTSELPDIAPISARFTGELTDVQRHAVDAVKKHLSGVLVAPPGSGKTVMACALIAHHHKPTAIIVNRSELLSQWQDRLATFLQLGAGQVGSLGAGKDRRGHVVDLIMLQTLSHRDAPDGLLDGYGLIVVDECHAVGAQGAEAAIRKARAERWIGLSATPYRADQMDPLITMQCGTIRHEIADTSAFTKYLVVHPTSFTTDEPGKDGASYQAIYTELATNPDRNTQIAADIADAARRGRHSLALTNRVEHLHQLSTTLAAHGIKPLLPASCFSRLPALPSPPALDRIPRHRQRIRPWPRCGSGLRSKARTCLTEAGSAVTSGTPGTRLTPKPPADPPPHEDTIARRQPGGRARDAVCHPRRAPQRDADKSRQRSGPGRTARSWRHLADYRQIQRDARHVPVVMSWVIRPAGQ